MEVILFDIDGTIANLEHRLYHIQGDAKNWDAFFDACCYDLPIKPVIKLARALNAGDMPLVLCSGRSERVRAMTEEWVASIAKIAHLGIYMRKDGDHRPDHLVKRELLTQIRADGREPILAIDDRNQVVQMWRAEGLTCLQCADGDF